jgi:hypothetical protein
MAGSVGTADCSEWLQWGALFISRFRFGLRHALTTRTQPQYVVAALASRRRQSVRLRV